MRQKIKIDDLIANHRPWIFDCDGVILDSNSIKSNAFYEVAKSFGHKPASLLVEYHKQNGGISRFKKFEWFLREQIGSFNEDVHRSLCLNYGIQVKSDLMNCSYTNGFIEVLDRLNLNEVSCFVASGGFEEELHEVFKFRNIYHRFNGIFGSPKDKLQILEEISYKFGSVKQGVFLGDAKADFVASEEYGMRFVFVRDYSESLQWLTRFESKIESIANFSEILE